MSSYGDDWNQIIGTGSLHGVSSWTSCDPLRVSSRAIGFGANIDAKLRYNVRAETQKISMEEAASLIASARK